jgi:ferrochelatase
VERGVAKIPYQSRVGPTKWLGPDTIEFLEANARDRVIVAVPIAFVSPPVTQQSQN